MPKKNRIITRYGEFLVPDVSDAVVQSLMYYGEWAQDEINIMTSFVRSGETVYDIGAFVGTHALAFSEAVGRDGQVFSLKLLATRSSISVKT